MRVHIFGAAGTVTGSKYLVECERDSFLVDCGLFQGRKALRKLNWREPEFEADKLSGVVLTHAHIDHTGFLPVLVKYGFNAPIYCTEATAELLKLLIPDSAHLQEEEARWAAKKEYTQHNPPKPLYTQSDALKVLSLIKTFSRETPQELFPGVHIDASRSGHILGACSIGVESGGKRVLFSGDVGRYDIPILCDPQPTDLGDLLLCETTYGDRVHATYDVETRIAEVIKLTIERNGPLIIPSFAVGRTQLLLYLIAKLERESRIPALPVFVDSPMAIDATELYRKFKFDFDEDSQALIRAGEAPLKTEKTLFCRTVDESKRLNRIQGAAIIISASGMVNGGRILHHMRRWLPEEKASVLFVGYQAHGTRGRIIQSGSNEIKLFGEHVPIRAKIETISGLSAHGDSKELIQWLKSCSGSPSQIRLVHGEPDSARAFAKTLKEEMSLDATPAYYREVLEV